jgi:hypothetical protein
LTDVGATTGRSPARGRFNAKTPKQFAAYGLARFTIERDNSLWT